MLAEARERVLLPAIAGGRGAPGRARGRHASLAMLSRTHGQAASPTTLGKEAANFAARLARAADAFRAVEVLGKFNGAVGCFNAHVAADPSHDWRAESRRLIAGLGLAANEHTTQIEPHDWIAAYCDALARGEHDPRRPVPRRLGLRLARVLRAEGGRRRGRLVDHAAQGEPDRLRERRGQRRDRERDAAALLRRSCRCRAGSAT